MKPVVGLAALLPLFVLVTPSFAALSHPVRPGAIDADPQTVASITQGPDMITRAGSSQKMARADLDNNNIAIARSVTAKRWPEIRDRGR